MDYEPELGEMYFFGRKKKPSENVSRRERV